MTEWINIVVTAVCAIAGAFGGGTLLYFRQNKRQKDIDNELKEANEWESMYREERERCDSKERKIDELRHDVNNLREEKIKISEAHSEILMALEEEKCKLQIKLNECNWYRCERCGCQSRKPKREIDIPAEGGGYED